MNSLMMTRMLMDIAEGDPLIEQVVNRLISADTPGSGVFELGMAIGWANKAAQYAHASGKKDIAKIADAMVKAAKIKILAKKFGL